MRGATGPLLSLLGLLVIAGCADDSAMADAGPLPSDAAPDDTVYREWVKIELPDTFCGNGSPYKFFVNRYPGAEDLLVYLEAGGACWDYASCTGGARGAAHPDGVPDDLMEVWELGSPMLRRNRSSSPVATWNMVFLPYCTGDVHIGDRDETYEDPDGVAEPLVWRHHGARNVEASIGWMREAFDDIDQMLISGCSAGGAGAINNYYRFRTELSPRRGYLLNDSGPIFPSASNSALIHQQIRSVWNLDAVIRDALPEDSDRVTEDLGAINDVLAERFPDDRLAVTFFRYDFDYALYSYERFYDFPPREEVYRLWWEDTQALVAQYDAQPNLSYFIPYYRDLNNSHCLTIGSWVGTEIEELEGVDVLAYLEHLLDDDAPLESYLETTPEGPYAELAPE